MHHKIILRNVLLLAGLVFFDFVVGFFVISAAYGFGGTGFIGSVLGVLDVVFCFPLILMVKFNLMWIFGTTGLDVRMGLNSLIWAACVYVMLICFQAAAKRKR